MSDEQADKARAHIKDHARGMNDASRGIAKESAALIQATNANTDPKVKPIADRLKHHVDQLNLSVANALNVPQDEPLEGAGGAAKPLPHVEHPDNDDGPDEPAQGANGTGKGKKAAAEA